MKLGRMALQNDCCYAECCHAECCYAECRQTGCRYAECRQAGCYYAECRGAALAYSIVYDLKKFIAQVLGHFVQSITQVKVSKF